jgi:DNA-binding transcriptional ArsR family regulator
MPRPERQQDPFAALSHPLRRAVLQELRAGEKPATRLGARFGVTPSALSQHLRALKDARLVVDRREGRQRLYRLNPAPLRDVAEWIAHFSAFWPRNLGVLGAHLRSTR